jgi:nitrogen fixation/metabolism regulation signal transduction histidine kinase
MRRPGNGRTVLHAAQPPDGGKKTVARRTTWRNRQLAPTPDRYREIQQAMVAKAEAATGVAHRWFLTTLEIAATLVLTGVGFALVLAHRIVRPLSILRATATRIAWGDLDATAEITAHDEVGQLAADFNRMAERIREVRRSDLGKLLIAQQTTEAAINSLYDPVIVTDAQGAVTRLNPAAEEIFGPATAHAGLRGGGPMTGSAGR